MQMWYLLHFCCSLVTLVNPFFRPVSKLHSCACPARPCHVALYLQHLIDESHSPCVVDSAFYGIKWAHTMAGIPSPTDNPVVEAVRCASKRILGTRVVNRKEPISSSVIHDLIGLADLQNPVHLRNITMYVLSFAGFLDLMMFPELGGMIFSFTRVSWSSRFSKVRTTNSVRAMR